jgi:hypothetical protein
MTGDNDHISLFDSVEDILQYFKFRYCGEEKDVHLMLFDPQDGCYHSYLTSSTEHVTEDQIDAVKNLLKKYKHKTELRNWIERNVRDSEERELARAIINAGENNQKGEYYTSVREFSSELGRRKALQILLSSLPSYYRWDICGYYDRHHQESSYPISIWYLEPLASSDKYHISGFSFKNEQPEGDKGDKDKIKTIIGLEGLGKSPYFKKIVFRKDYEAFHKSHIDSNYYHEQKGYDKLYYELISILYAGKFDCMIYTPVSLSHLYLGIIFIPLENLKNGEGIDPDGFRKSMDDFRIEKHRNFFPALEKLWLTEFDKMMFKDISIYNSNENIIENFCYNINYIVKCEKCLLIKHYSDNGVKSKTFWEWKDKDNCLFREFKRIENGVKLEELRKHIGLQESRDSWYNYFQYNYAVVPIEYHIGNENYSIYLLTRDNKRLKKKEYLNLLKSIIQHRRQLIYQKLQNIAFSLFPQIKIMKKFGTKAAVSAIISRNHSHHIGSHVMPRTEISMIQERLKVLGYTPIGKSKLSPEVELKIIDILRNRLDKYIQKKADFLAAIATEPIYATITKGFFYQVILDFIKNTLLMDNIGANESVNYYKEEDSAAKNRIRIHCTFFDREQEQCFTASFNGVDEGDICSCGNHSYLDFPYSGVCLCDVENENVIELGLKSDLSNNDENPIGEKLVAWPGPLGEYALYCFLENLIRNSVKHNPKKARSKNKPPLNIHIELRDFDSEYYSIHIWEDWSSPEEMVLINNKEYKDSQKIKLYKYLSNFLDKPIVNDAGSLRGEAWGLAEMSIMATLLSGSDRFTDMKDFLDVTSMKKGNNQKKRLVYTLKMMKPKELAIISRKTLNPYRRKKIAEQGVWWFESIESFEKDRKETKSIAGFNIIFIDHPFDKNSFYDRFARYFPYRTLINCKYYDAWQNLFPGAARTHFSGNDLLNLSPSDMLSKCWAAWINHIQARMEYKNPRVHLYLQQESNVEPTESWVRNKWLNSPDKCMLPFAFSVITKNRPYLRPEAKRGETHFIFDRHFDGYRFLKSQGFTRDDFGFHEAFDKNSSDFTPLFFAKTSVKNACEMAEASLLSILVLDERIAQISNQLILKDESYNAEKVYEGRCRLTVGKWSNLFFGTHISINGEKSIPLHEGKNDAPRVCAKCFLSEGKINAFRVYWCAKETCDPCPENQECPESREIRILAAIIHQDTIENGVLKDVVHSMRENQTIKSRLKNFINDLREKIPFIVIESGRGITPNLPDNTRFIPFSLMDDMIMRDRLAKLSLTGLVMGTAGKGGE